MVRSPETVVAATGSHESVRPPRAASPRRRYWYGAAAFGFYVVLAVVAYSRTGLTHGLPGCACGDQAQEVWFLAWPSFALQHGHNPLFTTWVNYPNGVNLADNTSMPLLGFLAIPFVLTVGPVAAFNIFLMGAFATSAISMCLVLRRWVHWWPAAFLGGLLYGFSPYMIGQGWGHLSLAFVPLPPLILLVLDDIVVRQDRSARRSGLILGFLAAAQYYISGEVLALTAMVAVIGCLLLAAQHRREITVARMRHCARAFGYAALSCALLIAYSVWISFFGPEHFVRLPQPANGLPAYPGDLLGGIVPTKSQLVAPEHLKNIGNQLTSTDVTENGMYLGVPLIAILVAITWAYRRVKGLVFFSVMLIACYLLALGSRLHINGRVTGIRMPFAAFARIPVVQNILPVRFSLFIQLFAALVLCMGLDRCYEEVRARSSARQTARTTSANRGRRLAGAAAFGIATTALFALVPAIPYAAANTAVPSLFDSPSIDNIAPGSVVLTYPYPFDPQDRILLPQAISRMRFKIVGGPGHVPQPVGTFPHGPSILSPPNVQRIFNSAFGGLHGVTVTASDIQALRTFLVRYKVDTIVVYPLGRDPGAVIRYVSALLGGPDWQHQVVAWFHVQNLRTTRP